MNHKQFEENILNYLEGRLSPALRAEFEVMLTQDSKAKSSFDAYQEVMQLEGLFAAQKVPESADFSNQVLTRIAKSSSQRRFGWSLVVDGWRLFMETALRRRLTFGGVAGLAVFVLCLKLVTDTNKNKEAIHIQLPNVVEPLPSNQTTASSEAPVHPPAANQLILPTTPGNRAVTVVVDQTSGIEGHALPGTRVDIVQTYRTKDGSLASRIISPNARVLSAGGDQITNGSGKVPNRSVTLDMSASDALKIQEARQNGRLSLLMRSGEDTAKKGNTTISLDDLYSGRTETMRSPSSGKIGRMLTGGQEYLILPDESMQEENAPVPPPAVPANSYARSLSDQYYPGCCDFTPTPQDSRSYNTYEENGRILVSQEPMSTFSIDVDTASYSQARRSLQEGHLPQADSIRIEEFLNYFNYNYPVQTTQPFTLSYEVAPSPLEKDKFLLKLGIKAKDVAPYEGGWNLVFLVDVSGSMNPEDKLPLVKKALSILVDQMKPEDRVAIVTYAGDTGVALDSTPASEKGKILAAIGSLGAGGSTNGSGGIIQAYQIAERYKRKGAVNRVILATDGDFNVGVTSQSDLIKLIEEKRKSGITLTTIGVGQDNLKDGTLEQLADKGNGNYFYLDSLKEARKVMQEDLTKNMEVIAKDVKLQIEFNPAHVKSYRLIGYDNRRLANKDFNNDKIDAGEIGAGHTVTALYELVLNGTPAAQMDELDYRYKTPQAAAEATVTPEAKLSSELAFLKIRYKEPEGSESKLLQYPLEAAQVQKTNESSSQDFKFASAVSYFAHIMRESTYKGDYTLRDVAELATASRGADKDGIRQEFIEIVKNAAALQKQNWNTSRE